MEHCPLCDGAVILSREARDVTVGKRTVNVEHEFYRCDTCTEEFLAPGMMDAVLRRAADQIRVEDGLLRAGEIAALRRDLGFTQTEFEAILNSGAKTVTRWERGTVAPTGSTDTLLRVFRKHPEIAHEIAVERGIRNRPVSRRKIFPRTREGGSGHGRVAMLVIDPLPQDPSEGASLSLLVQDLETAASAESPRALAHAGPSWRQVAQAGA